MFSPGQFYRSSCPGSPQALAGVAATRACRDPSSFAEQRQPRLRSTSGPPVDNPRENPHKSLSARHGRGYGMTLDEPLQRSRRPGIAPRLQTERLILRPHRPEDFTECAALWTDPAVVRYTIGSAAPAQRTWQRLLAYCGHWQLLGFGYWAVESISDGRYIASWVSRIFTVTASPASTAFRKSAGHSCRQHTAKAMPLKPCARSLNGGTCTFPWVERSASSTATTRHRCGWHASSATCRNCARQPMMSPICSWPGRSPAQVRSSAHYGRTLAPCYCPGDVRPRCRRETPLQFAGCAMVERVGTGCRSEKPPGVHLETPQ